MLSAADNETLTRVGPGTEMGGLMRRYWIPLLLAEELPEPDGEPLRVRLLGEDLVAFRATNGHVGVLGALCPHRGAPLVFGRNECDGLRCMYHGWKFDLDGNCTDMPNVPPDSDFKRKVRHTSYPCVQRNGVVWTYMGDGEPPALPAFDWTDLPPEQLIVSKQLLECNYAQAMEGDFDPSHISFLHGPLESFREFERRLAEGTIDADDGPEPDGGHLTPELELAYWTLDMQPVIMAMATPYGMFSGARRRAGRDHWYFRFNHFVMPFYAGVPRDVGAQGQVNVWVPVDDERTLVWRITYRPERAFTEAEREEQYDGMDVHITPEEYLPATPEPWSRWAPRRNRSNDYGVDRVAERTERFAAVPGVWAQDRACTEGMGAIMDRTQERLASSDVPVIQMRRILVHAARELAATNTSPPGVDGTPTVSAIPTCLTPRERSWEDVADDVAAGLSSSSTAIA